MNQWAWIAGNTTVNQLLSVGKLGVTSPDNLMSARWGHTMAYSRAGGDKLFVFGGAYNADFSTSVY